MEKHEGIPLVTKPLTDEEALALIDKSDNTLTVCVLISVDDLIDCGDTNKFDDFNDGILPRVLESDHRFTDISYDPIGIRVNKRGGPHASISDGPNEIILQVCGSLQDLVDERTEENEEDGTANELEDIDPNPGHDPND